VKWRYVLDIGQSEDWLALEIALLPCLIGYGRIARRLYDDSNTVRQSRYWKWIETYVAEEYCEAMRLGSGERENRPTERRVADYTDLIEEAAVKQSLSRMDELAHIFIHATKVSCSSRETAMSSN
jgi:ATP-dependent RNA helicase DDX5/DBP2